MPQSGLSVRRIAVTVQSDGRMFAGNVEVTVDPPSKGRRPRRSGPWPLSEATAVGLGVAIQHPSPVPTFGLDGSIVCRCHPGNCTKAEREAAGCKPTRTVICREDGAVRLHRCRICPGLFIGHYSARFCSDGCAAVNHRNWVEAYRPPPRETPSKAASRRAAATCRVCGKPFKALRLSARFCSGRCRQKHHRLTRIVA